MTDLKKENDSPVHMGQELTDERLSEIRDNWNRIHAGAVGDSRGPFKAIGELLGEVSRLHAALVVAEKERDQHKAFINALATEQRPSGRFGDHPTDGARAAREYLK